MLRLAQLAIRRPVPTLAVATAVAVALALVGLGVADRVSPSIVVVPGTESSRAEHLARAEFGPSVLVPVLLEGPREQLDRQGPALVRALADRPDTRVLSAWDAGETGAQLRPRPNAAMIVASVARTEEQMVDRVQDELDVTVARTVDAPVRASITGQPTLDAGFRDAAVDATRRGALRAVPILLVLFVLLLRAPVAALGLAALSGATALSGLGLMALLATVMDVDAIAMTLGTMTGLALGAGYGLLVFMRWRQEVDRDAAHHDATQAAVAAVATSGRGVLVGGTAVIVALLVATAIAPTEILASLGVGALLCATVAVGGAVVIVPAALTLLGHRALALSFGLPLPLAGAWTRLTAGAGVVLRHAPTVGAVATAVLVALAIPALSLDTGPPSPQMLPADSQARTSFERVSRVMGPGWPTPFNIVVVSASRPITDATLLRRLDRVQTRLARDPRVVSVVGPGAFAPVSRDLGVLPRKLRESTELLDSGEKDLGRLEGGLGKAGAGAAQLRGGLSSAASGAEQLQSGSGSAKSGAARLRDGLEQARAGAARISGGLGEALDAGRQLRDGAQQLLAGSQQLRGGLGDAAAPVREGPPIVKQMAADVQAGSDAVTGVRGSTDALVAQLDEAVAQLQALPSAPEAQAALGAVQSARQAAVGAQAALGDAQPKLAGASAVAGAFATQVGELSSGLARLYAGSTALTEGIGRLRSGNAQLAAGIGKLSGGGGQLTSGISALRDGAARLESGLGRLASGAGQLAGGLAAGTGPTGQLVSGLGRLGSGVARFRSSLPSTEDVERLDRRSPGLFDSGYFVLAAIEGARPAERNQATFAVNLAHGGTAGQIVVVARQDAAAAQTQRLGEDLREQADAFAAASGTQAAVGGPAGQLGDFESAVSSRIWPVVAGIVIAVALLLMAMLRSVVLPLVAVAFDVLTAAAAFGVATLLFSGDGPLLGGPGFVDPMTIIAGFAAIFGITMVYEVQLLQRTRDALGAGAEAGVAIRTGLDGTAGAATGAALAMVAAIVPFALSDLSVVRQLGVVTAVAILLDAVIVRPVLLPAAIEALGERGWWPTHRTA